MFNSDNVLLPDVVEAGFDPFRARVAMGGFLAGHSGMTFEAYGLDLRQWSQWCSPIPNTGCGPRRVRLAERWSALEEQIVRRLQQSADQQIPDEIAHIGRPSEIGITSRAMVHEDATTLCDRRIGTDRLIGGGCQDLTQ